LGDVEWVTVAQAAGLLVAVIGAAVPLTAPLTWKIAELRGETCPNCGAVIPVPVAFHGTPGKENMHSNRDCSKCGEPLIYWKEGVLAGRWRFDEREQKHRARKAEAEGMPRPG
jgi:hypothetical protein